MSRRVFCPKCKREMRLPPIFRTLQLAEGAKLRVNCGTRNCDGYIRLINPFDFTRALVEHVMTECVDG